MQKTAWALANLMNMWIVKGKKVTPDMLLGKSSRQPLTKAYISETRAHLRETFRLK